MTRDSKRHTIFLKIVCSVILVGHWFDFYLMITPGSLGENGGFGLMEIGMAMILWSSLTTASLIVMEKWCEDPIGEGKDLYIYVGLTVLTFYCGLFVAISNHYVLKPKI